MQTKEKAWELVPVPIKKKEEYIDPRREALKGYLWCEDCEIVTVHQFEGPISYHIKKKDDYKCIVCETKKQVYNSSDCPILRDEDDRRVEQRRKKFDLPDVHERINTRKKFKDD